MEVGMWKNWAAIPAQWWTWLILHGALVLDMTFQNCPPLKWDGQASYCLCELITGCSSSWERCDLGGMAPQGADTESCLTLALPEGRTISPLMKADLDGAWQCSTALSVWSLFRFRNFHVLVLLHVLFPSGYLHRWFILILQKSPKMPQWGLLGFLLPTSQFMITYLFINLPFPNDAERSIKAGST